MPLGGWTFRGDANFVMAQGPSIPRTPRSADRRVICGRRRILRPLGCQRRECPRDPWRWSREASANRPGAPVIGLKQDSRAQMIRCMLGDWRHWSSITCVSCMAPKKNQSRRGRGLFVGARKGIALAVTVSFAGGEGFGVTTAAARACDRPSKARARSGVMVLTAGATPRDRFATSGTSTPWEPRGGPRALCFYGERRPLVE